MKPLALFGLAIVLLAGYTIAEDEEPEYDGKYIEEYPSLVQIEVGYGPLWLLGCIGNVLTSRHILSAARCFSGPLYSPRFRRIRAGATFRGRDGDILPIESASNHPSYGADGGDGDITVVRLAGALTFGSTVAQGSIIGQGITIPGNLAVEHAGWGSTAQQSLIANRGLNNVDLVTISQASCDEMFDDLLLLDVTITENMVCAGLSSTVGRDGDLRDAGGPLYFDGVIVGVLSFAHYLGNNSFPLVATNVASYTDWIVSSAN